MFQKIIIDKVIQNLRFVFDQGGRIKAVSQQGTTNALFMATQKFIYIFNYLLKSEDMHFFKTVSEP